MPPRRSRRLAIASASLGDVPESLLPRILLDTVATHDLLCWVGRVAKVCRKWWRIVRGSPAYGLALPQGYRLSGELAWADYRGGEDERARVLRTISERLQDAAVGRRPFNGLNLGSLLAGSIFVDAPPASTNRRVARLFNSRNSDSDSDLVHKLDLNESYLGEEGGQALGAALQAWPAPLPLHELWLRECDLTCGSDWSSGSGSDGDSDSDSDVTGTRWRKARRGSVPLIAAALRGGFAGSGLQTLSLDGNTELGDAGAPSL